MQQIQTLKQAHEVLNGLMNAIIAVVYQLIYAPSPPSSPWWRWMHFHREHECSSDCLTITELNNGSHPILDVFKSITFLNQGNVTNKCHKWSCSLQRHGWLELNISEGRTTKPSSWVFKDVRWAEISPDAVQATSTLSATSANTHALRWREGCEVEPGPTHYTALNAGVFDPHR